MPKASIHKELPAVARGYDTVIIDGPPRVYDVARSAIMASDLIVVPIQPSPYDVWAAKEIVDLLTNASTLNETQKTVFVINRKIVNTAIGRDVVEALSGYPFPVLAAQSVSGSLTLRVPRREKPCTTLLPMAVPAGR